ncbi:MAG: hypothetical protein AUJ72_05370 [Candidatus Omnitrophica bacterium CG1_02_46_14]|nr:MAG: hypothetical protein AUJ72_05370 [Candidatus Omnitrophica bacterium CG1_02_46_14]
MLTQNLIHNASPAQAIGKTVWMMGSFMRRHCQMTKRMGVVLVTERDGSAEQGGGGCKEI